MIRPGASTDTAGLVAALGANVSFAIGVVLTKKLPTPESQLGATGWQLLLSSAALIPLAIATEDLPPPPSAANLVGFAYLSLVATGLAFAVWFNGVRHLPTPAPPLLGLAAPITGAALGWIVLDQDLTALQITGFAVTISAITYGATIATTQQPTISNAHRS